ncbi:MAG: hypothetical protein LBS85_06725 [Clostridiales Family XIII bacterium]|nr:hypothetical protein [Clostridiales Family XIII bacterium]
MALFGKKKKIEEAVVFGQNEEEPAAVTAAAIEVSGADDELIAVISAAVAAFQTEGFVQTLYIRKIGRAAGTKPAWGAMGLNEVIDTRRM